MEPSDTHVAQGDVSGHSLTNGASQASPGHHPTSLAAEIRERTGVNVSRCYQCGKCSAGCPMAAEMSLHTHDIMRLVQRDQRDRLLESDSIWLCLTCETCSARCPTGADPARVIDALRELALERDPDRAPRTIGAFNRSFLDQIRLTGRMSEIGLAAQYNIRSGKLLQDAGSMPALLLRGKLSVKLSGVRNPEEVRRIFRNVAKRTGREVL
jgi:heterodisulfide reductase subunit C